MNDREDKAEEYDAAEEAILEVLRKTKGSAAVSAMNPKRMKEFAEAVRILKGYAEEAGGKVSWQIGEPYTSMGFIRITGRSLIFTDSKPFVEAAKIASNVDAYALLNGSVCLDFTFHGMTVSGKRG